MSEVLSGLSTKGVGGTKLTLGSQLGVKNKVEAVIQASDTIEFPDLSCVVSNNDDGFQAVFKIKIGDEEFLLCLSGELSMLKKIIADREHPFLVGNNSWKTISNIVREISPRDISNEMSFSIRRGSNQEYIPFTREVIRAVRRKLPSNHPLSLMSHS